MTKSNLDVFIEKAKAIHGCKYDYNNTVYINSKTKVTITCPIHGDFTQTPEHHILRKQGCVHCAGLNKLTTDEFIKKARSAHGHIYDYSKTQYVNSTTKVVITCPIHGDFEQFPRDHYRGSGCGKCGTASMQDRRKLGVTEWISKAKAIHGNRYDYSKVATYSNSRDVLTIICPEHGEFQQIAGVHINAKAGCPYCSGNKVKPIEHYINQYKAKGYNYDYSLAKYDKATYPKIDIICPTHGIFQQSIHDHLDGHGCIKCAPAGFDPTKPATLYYLSIDNGKAYKIGITNRTVELRYSPIELQKITTCFTLKADGYTIQTLEKDILSKFISYKYNGIPLLLAGNTELFASDIFLNFSPSSIDDLQQFLKDFHDST